MPGAENPEHVVLRQNRGMRRATKVDTVGAGFAGVCDGTLTAGRILDAIAQLLGEDPVVLRDRTPASIRLLVEEGFLEPGVAASSQLPVHRRTHRTRGLRVGRTGVGHAAVFGRRASSVHHGCAARRERRRGILAGSALGDCSGHRVAHADGATAARPDGEGPGLRRTRQACSRPQ